MKSLLFPNPLYDHEEHSAARVDRNITFLAPEEQLQVSCNEGDQVEEVGDCVDRADREGDWQHHGGCSVVGPGKGGLHPYSPTDNDRAAVGPEGEASREADVPGGGRVDREAGGAGVPGVGRVDRETGGADVQGGGLVDRVAVGVWQNQARADPGGESPILYPYSPSDIFCFLCL